MREFAGKTAVVTGAASGMGLAFARRFAAEGMNVVLADIEQDALDAQVQRLEQEERSVLGVTVNTMRRETLERLRDETIERFGNVHILCNNAGVASMEDAGAGMGREVRGSWAVPTTRGIGCSGSTSGACCTASRCSSRTCSNTARKGTSSIPPRSPA